MRANYKNAGLVTLGVILGVAVTMQFSALAHKPVEDAMPIDSLHQLAHAYDVVRADYVEPVDERKLLTNAVSGMVASLDPHSAYLDRAAYRELREGTEGKFVGIGIEIGQSDEGYVKIVAPIEDSPAWRAGIKPGDLIARIDGAAVRDMDLDAAIKRMRGEPDSKVVLTIVRAGAPAPLEVTITRAEIVQKSVKGKIVAPGYAWVRIAQFQEMTVPDLANRLAALARAEPQLKGLVLDLRNDPGGLLQSAIGVAAAFLPKGTEVVATDGQLEESKAHYYGIPEHYMMGRGIDPLGKLPALYKTLPLVVLVNTGSASASEIVAGALQDTHRAAIVGSPTFGKGSVQTIRPLGGGSAVKLTTARYYTPNGRSIQARGIVPDFPVDENAQDDGWNALRMREADLQRHLSNDRSGEEAAHQDDFAEQMRILARARTRKPLDFGSSDDFQLAQALRRLQGLPLQLSKRAGPPAPLAQQAHRERP
ncbi:S41 family peptidase [Massilia forsythiae]|uniref:S41 family peptidase n=1 Tax=Massilia forsythiae TaxID=2728020 RepID=A0A7Z2VVK2_9BURK|nr:S41 family peptidase [Massilia forsythiae]QJD99912.1 S41 family peptidase [Massilia forsythiae]